MKVINSGNFGDIKSLKVTINGQEITTAVMLTEIFQEVFSPFWSLILTVDDNANMLINLPIRPGIEVTIEIETKNESILDGTKKYTFYIYKIGDKVFKGQMHQQYKVFCASKSFFINQAKRVSKSYSNQKPETIVSNVVSEFVGGTTETSTSDNNYHIIIPNWSPFTAVWWCAKVAIKNNASDFIFFMTDENKYSFKSLEELYTSNTSNITFKQKPSNIRNDSGDFEDDYSIMITKYHFEHYDGFSNLGSGYYKNKLLTYDLINKKWESKLFTFGDDNAEDKAKKPWESDLFDGAENANVTFLPKHPGMHEIQSVDDTVTTWHNSRLSRLMVLEQDKMQIQFPGGAKVWELLGKTCEIDLPSHQDQSDDIFDKYFRGKYLITHVYHHLTPDYYTCNIECNKIRHNQKMG